MGKSRTESYLATPPNSTFIRGTHPSEKLPELNLGPAQLAIPSDRDSRSPRKDSSPSFERCSSTSSHPFSPPPAPSVNKASSKSTSKRGKPSRKTTHSQIEKRRREKINDTMQRLKDLVPACHDADATLRKLDVLTATADYIEVLQRALRREPTSPDSAGKRSRLPRSSSCSGRTGGPPDEAIHAEHGAASPTSSIYEARSLGQEYTSPHISRTCSMSALTDLEDQEVDAAESLIQIAESPMLGPVTERRRLTISELMHL